MCFYVHRDHAGGNKELVSLVSGLEVCGNDSRIDALTHTVKHNQELKVLYHQNPSHHIKVRLNNNSLLGYFKVGQLNVRCLETPCHTTGHICYYVTSPDLTNKAVFTGMNKYPLIILCTNVLTHYTMLCYCE